MEKRVRTRLKKTLITMLGHQPWAFRLVGDAEGWIPVSDLAKALHEESLYSFLTKDSLLQFIRIFCSDLVEDRDGFVRCTDENLRYRSFDYPRTLPPDPLFIHVRKKAAAHIKKEGLVPPQGREWLVASSSKDTSAILGKRRGAFEMLTVDPVEAERRGVLFHYAGADLYLTSWLPASALSFPDELLEWIWKRQEEKRQQEKAREESERQLREFFLHEEQESRGVQENMPGSFTPSSHSLDPLYNPKEMARKRFARKKRGPRGRGKGRRG